jgi:hypothetical protein
VFDGELSELARRAAIGFDIFWCLLRVACNDAGTGSGGQWAHCPHRSQLEPPAKHHQCRELFTPDDRTKDEITYRSRGTCGAPPFEEDASSANSSSFLLKIQTSVDVSSVCRVAARSRPCAMSSRAKRLLRAFHPSELAAAPPPPTRSGLARAGRPTLTNPV